MAVPISPGARAKRRTTAKRSLGALGARAARFRQVVEGETITPALAMADTLILGLRLLDGVALDDFRSRFDVDALDVFGDWLAPSIADGLLEADDDRLRLTERGRLLANEVFVRLLPD